MSGTDEGCAPVSGTGSGNVLAAAGEGADSSFGQLPVGSATQPCDEDKCKKLLEEINDLLYRNKHENGGMGTHGLTHRFRELLSNMEKQALGTTPMDPARWQTHVDQIRGLQGKLSRKLQEYEKNCGDPPPGAWSYATREIPTLEQKSAEVQQNQMTGSNAQAAGKALGVTAGLYIAYRIVRFLPSLIPVLWPSIPANLAVP